MINTFHTESMRFDMIHTGHGMFRVNQVETDHVYGLNRVVR